MKIAILTNEYPPYVYGGAGVHVEYLTRELAKLDGGRHQIQVLSFGDQNLTEGNISVKGIAPDFKTPATQAPHQKFLDAVLKNVVMSGSLAEADVIHCHTWYSHLAGCLLKPLLKAKLVLTTHSLEPHRPWKVEQLGTAYHASSWVEETAYRNADGVVAVSQSMRRDVHDLYDVPQDRIRVIFNGIDLNQYRPTPNPEILKQFGIDPQIPYILFVGRITRQKGIIHLVNAIRHLKPGIQIVLCAGAPDTPEIGKEMEQRVEEARKLSKNPIIWIAKIVSKQEIITLNTHASLFVCPSVYEPFGIINLEAMACETPVVASAVGGIPEVVVPEKTGVLVGFEPKSEIDFEPKDPADFSYRLAESIDRLLASPEVLKEMSLASRKRVEDYFSWTVIARQTLDFYQSLLGKK